MIVNVSGCTSGVCIFVKGLFLLAALQEVMRERRNLACASRWPTLPQRNRNLILSLKKKKKSSKPNIFYSQEGVTDDFTLSEFPRVFLFFSASFCKIPLSSVMLLNRSARPLTVFVGAARLPPRGCAPVPPDPAACPGPTWASAQWQR